MFELRTVRCASANNKDAGGLSSPKNAPIRKLFHAGQFRKRGSSCRLSVERCRRTLKFDSFLATFFDIRGRQALWNGVSRPSAARSTWLTPCHLYEWARLKARAICTNLNQKNTIICPPRLQRSQLRRRRGPHDVRPQPLLRCECFGTFLHRGRGQTTETDG